MSRAILGARTVAECEICRAVEKLAACVDAAQHERMFTYDFKTHSVRPEVLEG